MKFYSTNNPNHKVDFREAVLRGLPPDNGLYMPEIIPILDQKKIHNFPYLSFQEIAYVLAEKLLEKSIEKNVLQSVVEKSITFDAPLIEFKKNTFSLELFHGPTLAFKDFAARFMAQLMGHFVKGSNEELTILVATSGDTGGAVASGFYKVPGIRVIVLYPSGKVSELQEKQLTTLGENITALEIDGTFDDCQHLVKSAFLDADVRKKLYLTSANSINIARLIPQSFYHAYAWSRLPDPFQKNVFVVPSGNFGNLTAGLLAKKMGVPITKFVAATNVNDVVPIFLNTGEYQPKDSQPTISNAMDVGRPSNFPRMLALYNNNEKMLREDVNGFAFTDKETCDAMAAVYNDAKYILDPHGAVGWLGLQKFLQHNSGNWQGVFFETAHPSKFINVVEESLGFQPEIPERLAILKDRKKVATQMCKQFDKFKTYLLDA